MNWLRHSYISQKEFYPDFGHQKAWREGLELEVAMSFSHQSNHRDVDEHFLTLRQDFIIFTQAPKLLQPGERALNNSRCRQSKVDSV
jgi:hypothetical protein